MIDAKRINSKAINREASDQQRSDKLLKVYGLYKFDLINSETKNKISNQQCNVQN